MVFKLLTLRAVVPHECATCEHQIGTSVVEGFIHEEVFLFPAKVGVNVLDLFVEVRAYLACGVTECRRRADERGLVIQSLPGISNEHRRDTQRITDQEHRRRGIPRRVTARLEGVTDTSARKRRCVGLLLIQRVTAELLKQQAVFEGKERVMLLGSAACERLEPVREVRCTALDSPLTDTDSHDAGYVAMDRATVIYVVEQLLQYILGYILLHPLAGEYVACKVVFYLLFTAQRC